MEITPANSGRIFEWCNAEPSDSYIKQEFTRGFEETSYSFLSNASTTLCPHCFMLPRYPLMLKCGHISCHRCFGEAYKRKAQCNHCRAPIKLEEVLTLREDRFNRPGSIAAKMYDETTITCTNIGCVKEFDIEHINKHEFIVCPFRLIKCPAKECYYKNNPTAVHKHALQCPYQMYYCATCYGAYGVEVLCAQLNVNVTAPPRGLYSASACVGSGNSEPLHWGRNTFTSCDSFAFRHGSTH